MLKNVFYNILAAILPIAVLQLLIYPLYSQMMSQEQYGAMITELSIITMIAFPAGNALNNVRLLQQNEYAAIESRGDYLPLLLLDAGIIGIVTAALFACIGSYNLGDILLMVLLAVVMLVQNYAMVAFIQNLDYKDVLISNVFLLVGYLIGFVICLIINGKWQYIYLIGYLCSLCYIQRKSHILSERVARTQLLKKTAKKMLTLISSTLISNGANYLDKILINPLLGAEAVTIYYVSTLLGKMIGMVIPPVNNIVLANLAKQKENDQRAERLAYWFSWLFAFLGCMVCIIASRFVLPFLYPSYYEKVKPYIVINTITSMIVNCSSVISPFLLKWCSMNWLVVINIVSLVGILLFSFVGYKIAGLYGYSLGILFNALLKYMIQFFILKYRKDDS